MPTYTFWVEARLVWLPAITQKSAAWTLCSLKPVPSQGAIAGPCAWASFCLIPVPIVCTTKTRKSPARSRGFWATSFLMSRHRVRFFFKTSFSVFPLQMGNLVKRLDRQTLLQIAVENLRVKRSQASGKFWGIRPESVRPDAGQPLFAQLFEKVVGGRSAPTFHGCIGRADERSGSGQFCARGSIGQGQPSGPFGRLFPVPQVRDWHDRR